MDSCPRRPGTLEKVREQNGVEACFLAYYFTNFRRDYRR